MLKLAQAKVWHKRLRPKINEFNYNVFYICFSLKELPRLEEVLKLNKRGILSFYNKDHGARDGSELLPWITQILNEQAIVADDIILLTYPRVFGYVFNPISFWYCLKGNDLIAVLAEVNNTFGESHNYLVYNLDKSPILPMDKLVSQKVFHVSPFCEVVGQYIFSFAIDQNNCFGHISHDDNVGRLLETSVRCKLLDLNKSSLRREFFRHPILTLMVVGLIHYQAFKLYLKRVKYNIKPDKHALGITTTHEKRN